MAADPERYPGDRASIRDFFESEAQSIQQGGPEYVYSKEWLGIYWPADEYVFIKLTAEGKLRRLLRGGRRLLAEMLKRAARLAADGVVDEAIAAQPRAGQPALRRRGHHGHRAALQHPRILRRRAQRRAGAAARDAVRVEIERIAKHYDDFQNGAARSSGGATRRAPISIADRTRDHAGARRPLLILPTPSGAARHLPRLRGKVSRRGGRGRISCVKGSPGSSEALWTADRARGVATSRANGSQTFVCHGISAPGTHHRAYLLGDSADWHRRGQ